MNLEPRSTMVLTKTYRTLLAYEVFEHVTQDIASFLSLQDILALTQVCQASRSWRSKIFSTFVTHLLKKWVSEPLSLRKVMHKTGSLISGSSVVWFLQRGPSNWSPGDLDVYTAYGRSGPIIDFFLKEGYTITRSPPEREDATYLVESTQLIKVTKLQKGEQKVDVLEGVSMYAMKPLLSFHTTVVMNYIAASSIGMLYPKPFFQNKGIIRDYKYQTDDHPWEDKYRDRSFTLARRVSEPCDLVLCPNLLRRPYDCHTLMVELPLDLEDDDDDNSTMDEDDIDIEAESQALKWILKIEKGGHDRCNEYECVFKDFGKLFGDHSAIMPLIVRHCYASVLVFFMHLLTLSSKHKQYITH